MNHSTRRTFMKAMTAVGASFALGQRATAADTPAPATFSTCTVRPA